MSLTSTLAVSVGPAIAKAILKVWLKDRDFLGSIGESITDLVSKKTSDEFAKKKAERQFNEIGDRVAQSLVPLFESDGSALNEGGKIAVAMAVAESLEKTPITAQFLLDRKLDPTELATHLIRSRPAASIGLSASETALYERTLTETSRYVVDMASQLPAFTEKTFAELIKKGDQLVEVANRILDEVRKIQLSSATSNTGQDASRFETEYRLAVGRKLNELELFGVDFASNANRRHRLSVAYVSLDVRQQRSKNSTYPAIDKGEKTGTESEQEQEEEDTVSVNVALQGANRLLVRGQAGSGKTTLLQWVAVKAASHEFESPLLDWNGFVPFYIRLRDCVDKGLPKPEEFPGIVAPSISGLMPSGWVHEKLKSGNAIVLIDGVDEMREAQRVDVRAWIKELCECFPEARIIVSSRPTAIKEGWMDGEGFGDAELQPMELPDIYSFIEHWHSAVREELQDEAQIQELAGIQENLKSVVRNTPAIRSLTTNPLLCAMLCALNRDRRQNLPSDRIELYEACCHMLAERRDKERQVTLQDYPQLSYRQKRPLLEDLAYWLITNDWSVVPRAQAEERLTKRLANMQGLPHGLTGTDVMRLFIDRTGLLREPQPNHVDFTHRTFQEFFAARAALDEGDVGVLVKEADEDMWREMIILAAGLASQKTREEIIKGLIARGDNEDPLRHSMHLLAVSCLETSVALDPEVLRAVEARLQKLVPPNNMSEAWGLASAGDLAVPHLQLNRRFYAIQKAFCIRALALIATDNALEALVSYGDDNLQTVMTALAKAWNAFDRDAFAKRVLSRRKHISFNRMNTLDGFEHCTHLERLFIWDAGGIHDLTPISKLQRLREIRLHNCWRLTDLKPLSSAAALETITVSGVRLSDLSPLADLPHVNSVHVDFLTNDAIIPDSLRNKVHSTRLPIGGFG
ncbi:MAG: NACHT domain-containing protein [Limisphaerales bacterium]